MDFDVSRRRVLEGVAGATVAGSAGCLQFVQSDPADGETEDNSTDDPSASADEPSSTGPSVSVDTVSLDPLDDFPSLGHDTMALAGGFYGNADRVVRAVDSDGSVRWESASLPSDYRLMFRSRAAAVASDTAYVCARSEPQERIRLSAFERGSGETNWTVSFQYRDIVLVGGVGATDGGVVIARNRTDPDAEGTVVALDASGEELWQETVDELIADVLAHDGQVFAMSQSTLFEAPLEAGGGLSPVVNLDRNESAGSHLLAQGVARRDGVIYPRGSRLAAVDLADGTVRWKREPDYELLNGAGPAATSDVVVTGTETGYVLGFDRASGDVQWTNRIEGGLRPHSHLLADGEYVWTGDDTGRVYGFRAADGELVHQRLVREEKRGFSPSVTATGGTVVINGTPPAYRVVE